ncbi:hypothetical protein [Pseudomonas sp. MBLB4136]|uniref:hypothetical protein n=1 Tax=Pseudomonas sp. MBLB4136 TaxID=3451558 RepID=UPI003F74B613
MNSDNPDSEDLAQAPLSDEQRLALLEKGRRVDRILLIGLTAMLAVILASCQTSVLVGQFGESDERADALLIQSLEQRQQALESRIAALEQQTGELAAASDHSGTLARPVVDSPDAISQVARTLIGQEQSYQTSLIALRTGMGELAGMIAGSRSWLDHYNEVLAKPLAESQARVKELQQWRAGLELSSAATPAAPGAP